MNKVGVCLSSADSGEAESSFLESNLNLVLVLGSFAVCLLLMIGCLCFCYKSKSARAHQTNPARQSTNVSASTDITGKIQTRSVEKLNPIILAQRLLQSNLTGGPQMANQSISNSHQPPQDNSMSRLEKEAIGGMSESPKSQGGFKVYRSKGPLHKLPLKDRAKLARQPSFENSSSPNSQGFKRVMSGVDGTTNNQKRDDVTAEQQLVNNRNAVSGLKEPNLPKLVESSAEIQLEKPQARGIKSIENSTLPPLSPGAPFSKKAGASIRVHAAADDNLSSSKAFKQLKLDLPVSNVKAGPTTDNHLMTGQLGNQRAPAVNSSGDLTNIQNSVLPQNTVSKQPLSSINPHAHFTAHNPEISTNKSKPDLGEDEPAYLDESEPFEPIGLATPMEHSNSPNQTEFILERDPLGESSLDIEKELNDTNLALPKRDLPK